MVYRFIILSDESEDFRRDITIDSEATFFDLHNAILDSVDYAKDQMTSFFLCSDEWEKQQEITLIEMDTDSDEDTYVMDATRLSDFLEDERQKLLYVFEYLTDRSFFMELREIIPGQSQDKAKVVRKEGKAPEQFTQFEEVALPATDTTVMGEDFFDNELNLDEYDEEDFGGLNEGNPFDNY
jgi:Plasmid pRiA4b ORF-3-like protein.